MNINENKVCIACCGKIIDDEQYEIVKWGISKKSKGLFYIHSKCKEENKGGNEI